MIMNPGRRRRRKRRSSRRRGRRAHRRYGRRRYRRNPGLGGIFGGLVDLAKQALPVLAGLYGSRFLVAKLGGFVPVGALGALAQPALAIGAVIGLNYATRKVSFLAKHRTPLMLGAGLAALDAFAKAFAPASVKGLFGIGDIYDQAMGEYVSVGDYLSVGGDPIDDDIAMSDYIAVGSDGVEEELGLVEQELGVSEELGNDLLGGVSQGSMLAPVTQRQFLQPVPARSFTRDIRNAGEGYDNPQTLYQGVFRGGLFG